MVGTSMMLLQCAKPSTSSLYKGITDAVLKNYYAVHLVPDDQLLYVTSPLCRFIGSANCHEGAVVANYPYDGFSDGSEQLRAGGNPSPDDATFKYLAKTYAKNHAFMSASTVSHHGMGLGVQFGQARSCTANA
jgi:hypothetical protein